MITYEEVNNANALIEQDEKEPYVGFQLGYFHSKNMGIKRVNTNNRYQHIFVPNFELKTNQDTKIGTRLYKQEVKDKQIRIDFAFDNLTQNEFDQVKNWLGNSEIQPLALDEEEGYSYVKIQGQPNINYICFDEEKDGIMQRVYKGEGSVNFIQYKMDKNKGKKQWNQLINKYVDLNNSYYDCVQELQNLKGENNRYHLIYKKETNNEIELEIMNQINLLYDIPIVLNEHPNAQFVLDYRTDLIDYIVDNSLQINSKRIPPFQIKFTYPQKLSTSQYYKPNIYPVYCDYYDQAPEDIGLSNNEYVIEPCISIHQLFNKTLLQRPDLYFRPLQETVNGIIINYHAPEHIITDMRVNTNNQKPITYITQTGKNIQGSWFSSNWNNIQTPVIFYYEACVYYCAPLTDDPNSSKAPIYKSEILSPLPNVGQYRLLKGV